MLESGFILGLRPLSPGVGLISMRNGRKSSPAVGSQTWMLERDYEVLAQKGNMMGLRGGSDAVPFCLSQMFVGHRA